MDSGAKQVRYFSRYFPVALACTAGLAAYVRLFFEVQFMDEAYYVALPYRYFMGTRPFVDELIFQQAFAVLIYPFVHLYLLVNGSSDAIVFFSRNLDYFLRIALFIVGFTVFRKRLGWEKALLALVLCVLYTPGRGLAVNYHSLSSMLFIAGLFILFYRVFDEKKSKWDFSAGILHGLSIFCYQPLIAAAATVGIIYTVFVPTHRLRRFCYYCLGGLIVGIVALVWIGPTQIGEMWNFAGQLGYSAPTFRIFKSFQDILGVPYKIPLLLFVFAVTFGVMRQLKVTVLVLPFLPAVAYFVTELMGYELPDFVMYWSLMGPWFFFLLKKDRLIFILFFLLWVPSLLQGSLYVWGAVWHGVRLLGRGMELAAIVTAVLLFLLIEQESRLTIIEKSVKKLIWISSSLLIFFFIYYDTLQLNQRETFVSPRVQVESGPFKHLWTNEVTGEWLGTLSADIKEFENPVGHIVFFPQFAAGYLLSSMPPAARTIWPNPENDEIALKEFLGHYSEHNIIVRIHRYYYMPWLYSPLPISPTNKFNQYLESHFKLVRRRPDYEVFAGTPGAKID